MKNKELFRNSPKYRAKAIRQLEKAGTINRLSHKEFGLLVYSNNIPSLLKAV